MSPPLKPGAGKKKARHKGGLKAPFLSKIALKNAPTFEGFGTGKPETFSKKGRVVD